MLKELYFSDCWKALSEVLAFDNVGKKSVAKKYHSVTTSKKYFFSDFKYGFRFPCLIADIQTVISRMAGTFNKSIPTRTLAFTDTPKVFDRVWCTGLLNKLNFF